MKRRSHSTDERKAVRCRHCDRGLDCTTCVNVAPKSFVGRYCPECGKDMVDTNTQRKNICSHCQHVLVKKTRACIEQSLQASSRRYRAFVRSDAIRSFWWFVVIGVFVLSAIHFYIASNVLANKEEYPTCGTTLMAQLALQLHNPVDYFPHSRSRSNPYDNRYRIWNREREARLQEGYVCQASFMLTFVTYGYGLALTFFSINICLMRDPLMLSLIHI